MLPLRRITLWDPKKRIWKAWKMVQNQRPQSWTLIVTIQKKNSTSGTRSPYFITKDTRFSHWDPTVLPSTKSLTLNLFFYTGPLFACTFIIFAFMGGMILFFEMPAFPFFVKLISWGVVLTHLGSYGLTALLNPGIVSNSPDAFIENKNHPE